MRRERGMQCLVTESEERKDVGGWGVKIDVNKKLDALSMEIMASFIALVTPILDAGMLWGVHALRKRSIFCKNMVTQIL